jgi:hypothetical protein
MVFFRPLFSKIMSIAIIQTITHFDILLALLSRRLISRLCSSWIESSSLFEDVRLNLNECKRHQLFFLIFFFFKHGWGVWRMNEFYSSKEFLFLFFSLSLSLRCLLSLSPLIDKASLYMFCVCCNVRTNREWGNACAAGWVQISRLLRSAVMLFLWDGLTHCWGHSICHLCAYFWTDPLWEEKDFYWVVSSF